MELQFTPDQEQQLAEIAKRSGTTATALVKEAALRLLEKEHSPGVAMEVPVLHLGATGSLHRRDIYNDVG